MKHYIFWSVTILTILMASSLALNQLKQEKTTMAIKPLGFINVSGGDEVYLKSKLSFTEQKDHNLKVELTNKSNYGQFYNNNQPIGESSFVLTAEEFNHFLGQLKGLINNPTPADNISLANITIQFDLQLDNQKIKQTIKEAENTHDTEPIFALLENLVKDHINSSQALKKQKVYEQQVFTFSNLKMVSLKEAQAFKPCQNLSFVLDSQPIITPANIVLTGRLTNKSNRNEKLIVFPVEMTSPFYANLVTTDKIKLKVKTGQEGVPVPPPPMALIIPAKTQVIFTSKINLSGYAYSGSPEVTVNWSFHYWSEPKPKGSVKVKLTSK